MSFWATYEHILHIESFRNIDLYQQGLYYLRFYLTLEDDRKVDYSQPYNYIESQNAQEHNKKGFLKRDNHSWAPAMIQDEISAFQTKTFMIRFQEETVEVNETCFFKIALPAYPAYHNYVFTLYCELMCADIQKIGGPPSEDQDQLFKCVTVFQAKIRNSHNSIHEYIPILFDNHHFCVVNCTIHAMVMNFKFKLSDMQLQLAQKENTKKPIFNNHGKEQQTTRTIVSIQPKSFLEFINKATQRFDRQSCEEFFAEYVGQLRLECCNTLQLIQKISQQVVLNEEIELPIIPDYSHLVSVSLTDTQFQRAQGITDIIDVRQLRMQSLIAEFIEKDIAQYSATLFELNNIILKFIQKKPKELRKFFQKEYQIRIKDRWGEGYLREQVKTDDFITLSKRKPIQLDQIAHQLRKKTNIVDCGLDVVDQDLIPRESARPIIYEEIHVRAQPFFNHHNTNTYNLTIIILVHGFQGNSYDMRLIKNNLSLMYPDHLFLCSRANEEQTDGHIGEMGRNLAIEVKQFIKEWASQQSFKLVFIGHSLGGIIIRAALPLLKEYQHQMHSFVTMSSPHLGYMYNSSKIVEAGLWVLKRMRKSFSLQQLSMTDAENIEDTFLYKLSREPGLNWFQNIMFLSSQQDQYVPFESARISQCSEALGDPIKGKRYSTMVKNLLGSLRANQINRIEVNFVLEDKVIDNMIGRSAHIQFLENSGFLKTLVYCTEGIFQ